MLAERRHGAAEFGREPQGRTAETTADIEDAGIYCRCGQAGKALGALLTARGLVALSEHTLNDVRTHIAEILVDRLADPVSLSAHGTCWLRSTPHFGLGSQRISMANPRVIMKAMMNRPPASSPTIGFIGFGEAARAFVSDWRERGHAAEILAYDVLLDHEQSRDEIVAACSGLDVKPQLSAMAVRDLATHLISAVTVDQILDAARSVGALGAQQRYLDINSASPKKKQAAAEIVGTGYLDVAVLSPVHPKRSQVPILVGGTYAENETEFLDRFFPEAEAFSDQVGEAAMVKMVRSVFVKGIEALSTECALAIFKLGLADRVFPSLDLVLQHDDAHALASYTMQRVAVHGVRRAAEMEEVCDALADLGLPNSMSKGAAAMHRLVGELDIAADPGMDAETIAATILKRIA